MGFFVNQVVLCTDLSGNPTLRDLLARVREVCLGAYANHEVPFQKVVEAVNPTRSLDRTPLFQVKLDLLNASIGDFSLPGLDVSSIEMEGTSKFDLELILWNAPGGLHGYFEYSTDLFEAATVDQMIEHLHAIFAQMAADPSVRVLEIPLSGDRRRSAAFGEADEFSFDP
jgi:non-ribosomal peptide synthetase component F